MWEYEWCQQNDMEVDRDEGMEEAIELDDIRSDSCAPRGAREGFKFFDITAILVEDEGRPRTTNCCRNFSFLRLAETNEPEVTHARWKTMIGEKTSRGKRSACLKAKRFENRMWERFAGNRLRARRHDDRGSHSVAAEEGWPEELPKKRGA